MNEQTVNELNRIRTTGESRKTEQTAAEPAGISKEKEIANLENKVRK